MNILISSWEFPPYYVGGIATYVQGLAQALAGLGHQVVVLASGFGTGEDQFDRHQSFRVVRFRATRLWALDALYVLSTAKRLRADVVISAHSRSQLSCGVLAACKLINLCIIAHGSELLVFSNLGLFNVTGRLAKISYRHAGHVIPNSSFTRDLLDQIGVSLQNVTVIPPGIDLEHWRQEGDPSRVRRTLGIDDSDKVILTVARLVERKGQDMVIRALPSIRREVPNVKYIIGGEGHDKGRLRNLATECNVSENVLFVGHISNGDLIDYYDACDVFAIPNRRAVNRVEGFGIAFLEASARGKPVIAGRHGGAVDVVVDGETGFLVNPLDADAIASAIIRLLRDENLCRRLGQNGRTRSESFDWNVIARRFLDVLLVHTESKSGIGHCLEGQ